MRHIVTSFVAPPAPPHFLTLSQKLHDFRKQFLNIKCVFWFSLQLLSTTFLMLSRISRVIVINVKTSSCKVLVILVGFHETWNRFSKKKNSNIEFNKNSFSESRVVPCGRTDTQTGRMKLIIALLNFANAPKNHVHQWAPLFAVHCPTKNVLRNAANLLPNPGLQMFNILQFMRELFFFKYPQTKKSVAVKSGDRGGHKTFPNLETTRP